MMIEKEQEILILRAKIAETILAKIAKIDSFVKINDINLKWDDEIENLGNWCTKENTLSINKKFLFDTIGKNKDKSREEQLISTLQHELIHAFIAKNNNFKINSSTDASPVHQAIIVFFNTHGCKINSNRKLADIFKVKQVELYKLASNKDITFNELYEEINKWQLRLKENLDKYRKNNIFNKIADSIISNTRCESLKGIMAFFHESCEESYVEKDKINEFEHDGIIYKVKQYKINLGMDCNLDDFENFINDLIERYENKIRIKS